MKKLMHLTICIAGLLLLANYSTEDSDASKAKPRINFYGKLIDSEGLEIKVENIVISGNYKKIVFYKKPDSPDINPSINITEIDLAETKEFIRKNPDLIKFNKRNYIEVTIVYNDKKKTSHDYIIEASKRIECDFASGAGAIEKKVQFQGIKKLIINGFKEKQRKTKMMKRNL